VARPLVEGKTFAVRVRRRGRQGWTSVEAERTIGTLLDPYGAGVDLSKPQIEVRVHAHEADAYVVEQVFEGPDGLPIGVGGRALALISGGFDSAVAAWMMMRRGLRVDHLHFLIDCFQSEHAITVTHELCRHWGHGRRAVMHVVNFEPVKEALKKDVSSRVRQVVLKQLMVAVADRLAARESYRALITGDSLGQVSSQTLEHLAAVDRYTERPVLRPLAGMTKQEIIAWARLIGTHDLSARAHEVCDLSDGPVAVAARRPELERAHQALPDDLVEQALASCQVLVVEDWVPGAPMIPVVASAPEGVPVVRVSHGYNIPADGPVALTGMRAPYVAAKLRERGRQVWVVLGRSEEHAQ
jgi:thiamine biosynthesis protein ThiI